MVSINKVLRGLNPLTAGSIRTFIGSKEAEEGIGWFTDNEVNKILGDETSSNLLLEKLKNIQQQFEDIKLNTSLKKKEGTDWEYMQTRIFQAEMDVCHKFQLLRTILGNKDNNEKKICEIQRLRYGILNPNNGVLSNLSIIHQELVGQTVDSTKKGLIEIWYNDVCKNMNENPVSAKTCKDILMNHLTKAAILQLKGLLLFKGSNENYQLCSAQFKYLENNLKLQSVMMDTICSDNTNFLADPCKENKFYIRPVSGVQFEPFLRADQKTLVYEYHMQNNEEKKWIFERSNTFDNDGSLIIYGISSTDGKRSYISMKDEYKAIIVSEDDHAQPFFVMPVNEESSTKIIICKCQPESQLFLGHNLKFTENEDNREFTMTMSKPNDTFEKEHKWDILYYFINWLTSKI